MKQHKKGPETIQCREVERRCCAALALSGTLALLLTLTRFWPHALALFTGLFRQRHTTLASTLQHALVVLLAILLSLFFRRQALHGLPVLLQLFLRHQLAAKHRITVFSVNRKTENSSQHRRPCGDHH